MLAVETLCIDQARGPQRGYGNPPIISDSNAKYNPRVSGISVLFGKDSDRLIRACGGVSFGFYCAYYFRRPGTRLLAV